MRFTVFFLLLLFLVVSAGCDRGNNKLMVGSIKGPTEITENSSAEYKIDAHSDTGITYSWISNPVGTGTFSSTDTATVIFTAPEVVTDYPIVIRVVVNSDNDGPVIRSLDVNVLDVPDDEPGDDGDPGDDEDPPDPQNHPPEALAHSEMEIIAGWHTFQFTDDSTDEDGVDDIVKWEWDFTYNEGDGFNVESEEQNPEIRNYQVGFYPVMLRVTDSEGLSDMLDEPLLVEISAIATYLVSEPAYVQRLYEIATDSNGDVFLLGESNTEGGYLKKFSGGESPDWIVTFNNNSSPDFTITDTDEIYLSGGQISGFIKHIDTDGNVLNKITSQEITGDHNFERGYSHIDTTPTGNIIVVDAIYEYDGYTEWDPWFGPIWHQTYSDYYYSVQEFTPDLELVMQSETLQGRIENMVVSDSGNIYLRTNYTLNKHDENMNLLWTISPGTKIWGSNFMIDTNENAYLAGDLDFGSYRTDFLLAKYNTNGVLIWFIEGGDSCPRNNTNITLSGNRIFISGNLRNVNDVEVDMDTGPGVQNHPLDFQSNTYVSIYSLDGVYEDSLVWGNNAFMFTSRNIQITGDIYGNTYVSKITYDVNDVDPGAALNLIELDSFSWRYTVLWKIFPF